VDRFFAFPPRENALKDGRGESADFTQRQAGGFGVAGFGRIVLVGATVAVGLGTTMALRAQTALDDPKNAPKIFANTCTACHKSPQGLAKNGSASFLRQHYTTGPEMSNAMAAYLASNGRGEAPRKNEKKEPATAAKATPNQKQATGHPLTDGTTDVQRPSARDKNDKKAAKLNEPKRATEPAVRPVEPPPAVVDRAVQPPNAGSPPGATQPPASSTAALSTPPASPPAARPSEPSAAPGATLDNIPMPEFPTGPPADLAQPAAAFSSAPLP
jgi:hypothetical protein